MKKTCPNCGYSHDYLESETHNGEDLYCPRCKTAFESFKCPDCGNFISYSDNFCKNCGHKITDEDYANDILDLFNQLDDKTHKKLKEYLKDK